MHYHEAFHLMSNSPYISQMLAKKLDPKWHNYRSSHRDNYNIKAKGLLHLHFQS